MDWDNYRAFLEVYRSGDLGHAALALEMSVPTVRRRLDAVESQIGFPLFERTPRGLSPTPVARRLVHSIAAMGDSAAIAGTLKEGPARSITISADDSIACCILDASWTDLRRSRPNLGITVLTRRPHAEVCDARADVVISHVRPGTATARSAGSLDIGLFAHRDYLSRAGIPETAADLEPLCMVAAEADETRSWLEARLGLPAGCGRPAFRTDSYAGQLAAIEAGVGIGACYVTVAKARSDLVRVLPDVAASLDCWLWSTRSHLRDGAAALVFDSLTAALSEHARTVGRAGTTDPLVYPLKSMAA
jgi:DNA-binding transcriptional LysR family regulator